jgi:hypothetical protein
MPKCPRCDRVMATVLKREGCVVKTFYECAECLGVERARDRCRWCGALLTRNDLEDECERCHKAREENQPDRH